MSDLIKLAEGINDYTDSEFISTVFDKPLLPKLNLDLRYYQQFGVEYMLSKIDKYGFVLNADDVGIGKTAQAIACAQYYAEHKGVQRILIVCKKSIKSQWASEIKKFSSVLGSFKIFVMESEGSARNIQWAEICRVDKVIVIVNYHTFLTDKDILKAFNSQLTIIDEAHVVKAREGVMNNNIAEVNKGTPTILLTGTPIMSTPEDVFGIFSLANPGYLGDWESFCEQYFTIVKGARGPFISEYRNVRELRSKIQEVMIRRTEHEVAVELPKTVLSEVSCELVDDQLPYWEDMCIFKLKVLRLQKQLANKKERTKAEEEKLVQYDRILKAMIPLEQMVADDARLLYETDVDLYKVILKDTDVVHELDSYKDYYCSKSHTCIDLIEEIIESGNKVIVFSVTEGALKWLKYDIERLTNYKVLMYTGSVSETERQNVEALFKNNSDYSILLGTDAMAEGLNLQIAKYVINYNQPDSSAIKTQRIGRVRRVGSEFDTVYCYDLVAQNLYGCESDDEQVQLMCELTKDERKLEDIKKDCELNKQLVEVTPAQREALIKAMQGNPVALGSSLFETSIEDTIVLWTRTEKEEVKLLQNYSVTLARSVDTRNDEDIFLVTANDRLDGEHWKKS